MCGLRAFEARCWVFVRYLALGCARVNPYGGKKRGALCPDAKYVEDVMADPLLWGFIVVSVCWSRAGCFRRYGSGGSGFACL